MDDVLSVQGILRKKYGKTKIGRAFNENKNKQHSLHAINMRSLWTMMVQRWKGGSTGLKRFIC